MAHADALQSFCEWVLSFDKKLPNIIGDQATKRFHTDNGKSLKLLDTTSARIAYIDGRPEFSDVEINHAKVMENSGVPDLLQGAWSYTEYGADLRLLFGTEHHARFAFAGEGSWHGTPIVAFSFTMPAADNLQWEMKTNNDRGEPISDFPGYAGRILLNAHNFDLVRFERHTTEIEKKFPLRYGGNVVDYQRLPLGDGTSFVLPIESVVTFCHDEKHHRCEVNDTRFENWKKFAARSRILPDAQTQ